MYRIPTRQSCKTVILSFSFLTDDFPCLNKVFTLHYILTTRIEESRIREGDWLEESSTQPIVMITRNGEVGTPRLALAREQLETLQGTVVFQLPRVIVARLRCQVTVRMILRISCI